MATLIRANGSMKEVEPKARTFSAEELKTLVGGVFRIIPFGAKKMAIVLETGKTPVNSIATNFAHRVNAISFDDFIVGDVIICTDNEIA